ncbi:SDR family NAD(P)-dependent oxidoreductase [Actinomadura luteofluorescens]
MTHPAPPAARRRVRGDGVDLAVYEQGDRSRPTVLLVHGYPDTHAVWDEVAARLARRFHVVRYDVRGAGASSRPFGRRRYTFEYLMADMEAVLDATAPERKVHLVGHDWGSIQSWEAVCTMPGRFASFTSISGPCLDHVAHWTRRNLARPTPANLRRAAGQAVRSWYIYFFQTPGLPELLWQGRHGEAVRQGPGARRGRPAPAGPPGQDDGARRRGRGRAVPGEHAPAAAPPARPAHGRPDAGHRPDQGPVRLAPPRRRAGQARPEPVAAHAQGRALGAAQPPGRRRPLDHRAHRRRPGRPARRRRGARAQAGPGDPERAPSTAPSSSSRAREAGSAARPRWPSPNAAPRWSPPTSTRPPPSAPPTSPASSAPRDTPSRWTCPTAARWRTSPRRSCTSTAYRTSWSTTPGSAWPSPFLEHDADDWRKVLDVNLWGVLHGSRLFAQQMVERGQGGHIVNTASAAAFTPTRALPAYATSKAAVLMLSECLRAELKGQGIGVSAVCPGIVNTNITRTSRFVGQGKREEARSRERVARAYARRGYGPDRVAEQIVAAVRDDRAVVPVTPEARLGYLGSRVAPGVMRLLARLDVG